MLAFRSDVAGAESFFSLTTFAVMLMSGDIGAMSQNAMQLHGRVTRVDFGDL